MNFDSKFNQGFDFSKGFGEEQDDKKKKDKQHQKGKFKMPDIYQKAPDVNDESLKNRRDARERAAERRAEEAHAKFMSMGNDDDDDDD